MPIVETPRPDAPLAQGDIVRGVLLFATRGGWTDAGGDAVKAPFKLCLVLSRPCVVAHKKHVLVAGVDRYPDTVPRGLDDFEKVLDFLTAARDGIASPDVFYLGQLPGLTGRFCARLDSLHTIEIPTETAIRSQFLAERRVATLHADFARDLHVRLFNSVASLGFDDHRWLSTDDLQWVVTQGRADLAAAEQAVLQQEALQASRSAEGAQFKEADLSNARRRLEELRERTTPFLGELERRQTS